MDKRALIEMCLALPGAIEDYPFRDGNWAAMRHGPGGRAFAFVYHRHGRLCVNLKCEPMRADFLRSVYAAVQPGYHLNHQHWNTVWMDGDVPAAELEEMLHHSYQLTRPKGRAGKK